MRTITKSIHHSLQKGHHYCVHYGVYAVLLSSALALALLLVRFYFSRTFTYSFMVWNLFLAWMPYLAALAVVYFQKRYPEIWLFLLIPGSIWLIFFPNAPYMVTDFLHLRPRNGMPLWFDVGLLSVFAWSGLSLGVFSLRAMQNTVRIYLGTILSWLFVLSVLPLCGLGIYMGRFLRWNSWDLLLQPHHIFNDVATRLLNPLSHPGTLGVTLMFTALMFVCYITVLAVTHNDDDWHQA